MDYSVNYLEEKNIVVIKMIGRLSFQIAEQYSRDAVKLAHQNGCSKFLFDHTETSLQQGIIKIHMAGEELQQFGFKNNDRIAIIVAGQVFDSIATNPLSLNSRWSITKYFPTEHIQEAYDWLGETE